MRVCHTVPTFAPVVGGAEVNVRNIVITQQQQGLVQPRVLTLNVMPRWDAADLPSTEYLAESVVVDRLAVRTGNRFIRTFRLQLSGGRFTALAVPSGLERTVDLLHHHDEVDLSIVNALANARLPAIMHIRSIGFLYEGFKNARPRRKALLSAADHFICNSAASASYMIRLGLSSSIISVVPNAIDPVVFKPLMRKKSDRLSLLWVARGSRSKGLHTLSLALKTLKIPTNLDIVLGDLSDLNYVKEQMISFADITQSGDLNVRWHVALAQNALVGLYQNADYYIGTAPNEPFGNTNIEAMACGAVPVLPRSGGCVDIVTANLDGFFYDPGDYISLGKVLALAFEAKDSDWAAYRTKGAETIRSRFTLSAVTESLGDIYQTII